MSREQTLQWTVVGVIVLLALVWAALRIRKLARSKGKDSAGCSCCAQEADCKIKDLRQEIRQRSENCHDGQSARNL